MDDSGVRLGPLHQVAQRATDLDRSVAYYRDVLGLELIARFEPPGLAFFRLGDTRLLLEAAAPPAILYFRVPDIVPPTASCGGVGWCSRTSPTSSTATTRAGSARQGRRSG